MSGGLPRTVDFASRYESMAAVAAQLETLLGEEQQALRKRDAGGIQALVERKLDLLRALDSATAELNEALRLAGLPAGRQGIARTLAAPAAREAWQRLRGLGAACAEMNRTNGALIEVGRAFTGALLEVMRGPSPAPRLYDRGGHIGATTPSRQLARA
ncbi:MAG: flagella synthesis protein FlgN [Gammaproteobacteria bacterium]